MRRKFELLSFKKVLPSAVTSGNLLCGILAIILVIKGHLAPASWMVLIATIFDYLDGKVARTLGVCSEFGMELDSLADEVAFGVAPAIIAYSAYLSDFGVFGALAAAMFAICGALRLARFNLIHVSTHFEGLPIPAAGGLLVSVYLSGIPLHPFVALFIVIGTGALMVSTIKYSNIKSLRKDNMNKRNIMLMLALLTLSLIAFRDGTPLAVLLAYVISGPVGIDWGRILTVHRDESEEKEDEAKV